MRKGWEKYRMTFLFAAPFLLLFTVFTVVPVFMAIGYGFTAYNMLQPPRFVGLNNYLRLFLHDPVFIITLKNTMLLAVVTGPVSYVICLIVAWMIQELPPKIRAFLTLCFYAPSISGAVYLIWGIIFSSDSYGFANHIMQSAGFINEPVQWLQNPKYMLGIIMLVQIWVSLGTSFLAFIAGLQGVDRTLYEAAAVDGIKNRVQELWYVTIPAIRPQLMFGAVIQITAAFSIGDISSILAGNPSVDYAADTLVTHMVDFSSVRFELGMACALATVLFVMMVGSNKLVNIFLKNAGK